MNFDVVSRIGKGGFAVVDKIRFEDGTFGARKTFSPDSGLDDKQKLVFRERFEREVRVQSELDPLYVVEVLQNDLSVAAPWYVMPYAARNLRVAIDEARRSNSLSSLNGALADVLNGLESIHELGYVHRDLKPENVLEIDGHWRLADFGLVTPPSDATTQLTSTNAAWGTEKYAAPEQIIGFRSVTPAADIYAFGCILHDIYGTPPRIPYAVQTCAGDIGHVIEVCTDKNQSKRFKSIESLRDVLLTLIAGSSPSKTTATADQWVAEFASPETLDINKIDAVLHFLSNSSTFEEQDAVYRAVDESVVLAFEKVDPQALLELIYGFCTWINRSTFDFAYCDVLIQRLLNLFNASNDVAGKSSIIMAAAHLGSTHNRWFVMRQVVELCGPQMDENLAKRVAIEVRAQVKKLEFISCIKQTNLSSDKYHPVILTALRPKPVAPVPTQQTGG